MLSRTLLETGQTLTGVSIVQTGRFIFVFSPCCGANIKWPLQPGSVVEAWVCALCDKELPRQPMARRQVRSLYELPDDPRYKIKDWVIAWTHLSEDEFEVRLDGLPEV